MMGFGYSETDTLSVEFSVWANGNDIRAGRGVANAILKAASISDGCLLAKALLFHEVPIWTAPDMEIRFRATSVGDVEIHMSEQEKTIVLQVNRLSLGARAWYAVLAILGIGIVFKIPARLYPVNLEKSSTDADHEETTP
jgi:hypothetical protein